MMFTPRFEPVATNGSSEVDQGCPPVQTWRDLSGVVCAHGYAGPGWWAIELPRTGTFRLRRDDPGAIDVYPAPGATRARVDDLYRRTVVPLFLQALGHETLHASAITASRGAVAFCGERGAGKSTIAYALAGRGYAQHADDTLVLSVAEGSVTTEPLPFVPRLRPASAEYFRGGPQGDEPSSLAAPRQAPLSAVFVLHRDDQRLLPEVKQLPAAHALRALLEHAHCFEPGNPTERRRLLANYLEISIRIPVFDVTFAPGLDRLDSLLDSMLAAIDETGTTSGPYSRDVKRTVGPQPRTPHPVLGAKSTVDGTAACGAGRGTPFAAPTKPLHISQEQSTGSVVSADSLTR